MPKKKIEKTVKEKNRTGDNRLKPPSPRRMIIVVTTALAIMLAGGFSFHEKQRKQQLRRVEENLTAIARLKADEIAAWRAERIGDAMSIMDRRSLKKDILDYLATPSQAKKDEIIRRFNSLKRSYHYTGILLIDPEENIRLSLSGHMNVSHSGFADSLAAAVGARTPMLTDLHIGKNCSTPHISVIVPLFADEEPSRLVGAIILISNAREFLYPLIEFWPVSSRSSETLLVRRDGDQVLFLNNLRHLPDTALKLRISLSRTDVPAVMAVKGFKGLANGKDYRGEEVVSVILPVPDSPWFIVSKIDAKEAFAEWYFRSMMILGLILVVIGITTVSGFGFWQREKKNHFHALLQSEAERRAEAERYRMTMQAIGDAVISTGNNGRVEIMNHVAENLTGWSEREARGRPLEEIFRIVNEKSGRTVESPVTRVLREGMVVGLANHTILIARDGTMRPIADSGAPIRDHADAVIGVVLVFRDQTREREAQKALLDSERKYRRLFEGMTDAFMSVDMTGVIQEYNPACQAMLGYTDEELRGLTYQDLTPDKWHAVEAAIVEEQIMTRGFSDLYEKEYRRKDGTVFPVELRAFLIRNEANQPASMWAIARDITERKQIEKELRENELYIRTILDSLPIGIAVNSVDPDVTFAYMNDNFPKFYRTTREELTGPDTFWDAVYEDPGFREKIKERVLEDCASEDPRCMHWVEVPIVRQGKETTFIEAMNVPIAGTELMVSVVWDITERKQAEAERDKLQDQLLQSQKMEAIGRLAGGVAHDFNNMLNVILGYTELVLERISPDDPLYEDLKEIFDAGRRSIEITRQLLAFARKQTIMPRALHINETVEKMFKMLRRLIGENIALTWHPGAGLWYVYMDPAQIDQILANLLVNARDAIGGAGKITIETDNVVLEKNYCAEHADFTPGDFVLISVSDNGRGMDKETINRLFEPFFTTKDIGEGTGLGLATVYGIVKQNNGFINVYSEPGQGTTFKIYLPRHSGAAEVVEEQHPVDIPAGHGETVLVVEDENAVLKLAGKILTSLGYTVLAALNPKAALKTAAEYGGNIDLLMTDVVMPEMNGRDLAGKLRSLYPDIRVLFMSGYTANVIARQGILEDGVNFIQKPFNKKDLAGKIREALRD